MLNSLHARVLVTVVSIIVLTVCAIAWRVRCETAQALARSQDENARNILNAVVLSVENEYNSLIFHKHSALEIRKSERKNIVSLAMAVLRDLHEKSLSGEISPDKARERGKDVIRKMRYDHDVGYLWINDMGRPIPKMVMHPTLPELDNTVLDDPRFNCALGRKQNLFQAFVDACRLHGEGFVDYLWPKPLKGGLTADQPKISYVALFPPWEWVVGTGVYIEDIEAEAEKRHQAILAELRQTFARVRTAESGYLFIFNSNREMLVHPSLEGREARNIANPVTGNPIMEDLITAARTPERIFEYIWDKPPAHEGEYRFRKRAYVRYFAPLDWYIGSSLYVDEIEARSKILERRIGLLALAGLGVALLVSTLVARSLIRPLGALMAHVEQIEKTGIRRAGQIPAAGTIETRSLAQVLNKMVASVQAGFREKEALVEALEDARKNLEQRVAERTGELKTAVAELRVARDKAEIASQAKSEFLANMSHEIRTPMNAVLGFAEILREKLKDPGLIHYAASIHDSGKALLGLINDILDLSRVEAGKLELAYGPVNLEALFSELDTLFRERTDAKGLDFLVEVDPGLPRAVLMDKIRLRQILVNLLGNAVKFTEKGHVRLRAKGTRPAGSGKSLVDLTLRVSDTGIGMDIQDSKRIFDAFEQLHSPRSGAYGGTGLGLAITRRLTRMMKGQISVDTAPGQGTCFELRFREVEVAACEETTDNKEASADAVRFGPARILVVDDIPYNRELIRTYLDRYEFGFSEAQNGKEMLSRVQEKPPDLILLDMKMPVMDGYTAAARLRENKGLGHIPVIAITASAMKEDELRIRSLCDSYLKKPVSRGELIRELMRFLPHERLARGPKNPAPDTVLDAGLAARYPEMAVQMAAMAPDCRTMMRSMAIDRIEAFAVKIKGAGRSAGCVELVAWAEALHGAALRFDLERIRSGFKEFVDLFDTQDIRGEKS